MLRELAGVPVDPGNYMRRRNDRPHDELYATRIYGWCPSDAPRRTALAFYNGVRRVTDDEFNQYDWWEIVADPPAPPRTLRVRANDPRQEDLVSFNELAGLLHDVPSTWLPGLLRHAIRAAHEKGVFKPGGLQIHVQSVLEELADQMREDVSHENTSSEPTEHD